MANQVSTFNIPYPDFKLNDTIQPDEFDDNNSRIVTKANELIGQFNALLLELASVAPGDGGSHMIASAPVENVTGANVYEQIVSLKAMIDQVVSNGVADGSVTVAKLAADVLAKWNTILWTTGVNNILESGRYYVTTDVTNLPIAIQGYVEHQRHPSVTDTAIQVYTKYNSDEMWFRRKTSGTFTSWKRLDNGSIGLVSTTDLNTITTGGRYYGDLLVNRPAGITGWMFLDVNEYSDTFWCAQTAHDFLTGRVYSRAKTGGASTWSAWVALHDEYIALNDAVLYTKWTTEVIIPDATDTTILPKAGKYRIKVSYRASGSDGGSTDDAYFTLVVKGPGNVSLGTGMNTDFSSTSATYVTATFDMPYAVSELSLLNLTGSVNTAGYFKDLKVCGIRTEANGASFQV